MRTLLIGDIYGESGCGVLFSALPLLRARYNADFVIVNGENADGGIGITEQQANAMLEAGVDVITTGNHVWQSDIGAYLDAQPRLLRPENYGRTVHGHGYVVHRGVAVVNIQGRMGMYPIEEPVAAVERVLSEIGGVETVFVDMHAESSEEKEAVAFALDGRITALVGTHTHVQTADERLLPGGTAFITDLGMTGPGNSIIGGDPATSLQKIRCQMPIKSRPASGRAVISGVCVTSENGRATSIERFCL